MSIHTDEETVVLRVFNDVIEAEAAREKLEESNIPSFLVNENVLGLDPIAGVELKIFAKDLLQARQLLGE